MQTVIESNGMSDTQTQEDVNGSLPTLVTTSLYDLMAAMQESVSPEEDGQVVATIMHLFRSGRLHFVRQWHPLPFSPRQRVAHQPYTATADTAA